MTFTAKTLARLIAPFALTLGVVADGAAQTAPLTLQVYNADANSFHVNAVLVSGKTDAVLLDTGFTRADADGCAGHRGQGEQGRNEVVIAGW